MPSPTELLPAATVAERLPITLRAYRRAMSVATPLSRFWLTHRLRRGKELSARLSERQGIATLPRPDGALVWLHGASVGELTAAFPLIERMRQENLRVLVTSGTVTSAAIVKERLPDDVIHQFLPLDAPRFVYRFLHHWQPDLGLFIESDLWPNLIIASAKGRIPLIVLNGRMSEKSFKGWNSFPRTASALLEKFDLCLAQSTLDGERFSQLGMPAVSVTGNLKLDVPALPADATKLAEVQEATAGRQIFLAASTHPGEDESFIEAHRRIRKTMPGLLTIIAPRHPRRGKNILDLAVASGLRSMLRSHGVVPDSRTDIYVADTMGELGILYRLADLVFMGGSIIDHGGQNPIEAAKLGRAILYGPNVDNFADIYAALDASRGAEEIESVGHLTMRAGSLLKDAAARQSIADAGLKTIERIGGALDRTWSELEPYLLQLRLTRRGDDA